MRRRRLLIYRTVFSAKLTVGSPNFIKNTCTYLQVTDSKPENIRVNSKIVVNAAVARGRGDEACPIEGLRHVSHNGKLLLPPMPRLA